MQTITAVTRTLPPTDTEAKRVRVHTDEGAVAEYPWDHSQDAPEVHLAAVFKLIGPRPSHHVTVRQTGSDALGYTYLVKIEERPA
jgi:hypothetical protein